MDHLDRLDASLEKIVRKGDKNVILCGDFNCPDVDWNNHTVPARTPDRLVQQRLVEIADKYGLHQVHDQPTRGENLLDLVFSTNPTLLKATVSMPALSDHDMVVSDFCIRPFQVRKPPRKCVLFNKANWDGMRKAATEVSEHIASQDKSGADVNTLWETFRNQLSEATEKYIPSALSSSRPRLPWLSNQLPRLTKKKRRLYNQARRTGNWSNFKHIQKECKRAFRKTKTEFLNNIITKGLEKNNTKPFLEIYQIKRNRTI